MNCCKNQAEIKIKQIIILGKIFFKLIFLFITTKNPKIAIKGDINVENFIVIVIHAVKPKFTLKKFQNQLENIFYY